MSVQEHSAFRISLLQLWKEYRFRQRLQPSDVKYWSNSVFNQKVRMSFLDIFGLKRLSDHELLENLGYLEHSIRNNSRINQNLDYHTTISKRYRELKEEFDLRLEGKSEYVPIKKAIKIAKLKLN